MIGQSNAFRLVSFRQVECGNLPGWMIPYSSYFDQVLNWAHNYLCKSHPQLGRKGPVCPYVAKSMQKNLWFMTVYEEEQIAPSQVRELLIDYRDYFLEIEPIRGESAIFKTILILFPNLPLSEAPVIIDQTQAELINEFTPQRLMIGEFHPGPPKKAGLWNKNFKPLGCPVPMLVIRHMVPTDILFLKNDRKNVEAFLSFYGQKVPPKMAQMTQEAIDLHNLDYEITVARDMASAF